MLFRHTSSPQTMAEEEVVAPEVRSPDGSGEHLAQDTSCTSLQLQQGQTALVWDCQRAVPVIAVGSRTVGWGCGA